MKPEAWIAIYAAVVATSALLLNFRSWFEAGPRLHLSLMIDGMTIGGGPDLDEENLIILTVTNRGREPTMIVNMVLFKMESWYQRWAIRPLKNYVIPNPQIEGIPAQRAVGFRSVEKMDRRNPTAPRHTSRYP